MLGVLVSNPLVRSPLVRVDLRSLVGNVIADEPVQAGLDPSNVDTSGC